MPILNQEKFCQIFPNIRYPAITVSEEDYVNYIASILKLNEEQQEELSKNWKKSVSGSYKHQAKLNETLNHLYIRLQNSFLPSDIRLDLVTQLHDGVMNCISGFYVRANSALLYLNQPKSIPELLNACRHETLSNLARDITSRFESYIPSSLYVHCYSLVFEQAFITGYPLAFEVDDPYIHSVEQCLGTQNLQYLKDQIHRTLFTDMKGDFFTTLQKMNKKIRTCVTFLGYDGAKEESYDVQVYENFHRYLKELLCSPTLSYDDLFILHETSFAITDLNWKFIQKRILSLLTQGPQAYYTLTTQELMWIEQWRMDFFLEAGPLREFFTLFFPEDLKDVMPFLSYYGDDISLEKRQFIIQQLAASDSYPVEQKFYYCLKYLDETKDLAGTRLAIPQKKVLAIIHTPGINSYDLLICLILLDEEHMSMIEKSRQLKNFILSQQDNQIVMQSLLDSLNASLIVFFAQSLLDGLYADNDICYKIAQSFPCTLDGIVLFIKQSKSMPLHTRVLIVQQRLNQLIPIESDICSETFTQMNALCKEIQKTDKNFWFLFKQSMPMQARTKQLEAIFARIDSRGNKLNDFIKSIQFIVSDNIEFMALAVTKKPVLFQYASPTVRANTSIQAIALFGEKGKPEHVALFNNSTDFEQRFSQTKLPKQQINLSPLPYLPISLKHSKVFLFNLLRKAKYMFNNNRVLEHFLIDAPPELINDESLIEACIQQELDQRCLTASITIKYASQDIKTNLEFIKRMMCVKPGVFLSLSSEIKGKLITKNMFFEEGKHPLTILLLAHLPKNHAFYSDKELLKTMIPHFSSQSTDLNYRESNLPMSGLFEQLPEIIQKDPEILNLIFQVTKGHFYTYFYPKSQKTVDKTRADLFCLMLEHLHFYYYFINIETEFQYICSSRNFTQISIDEQMIFLGKCLSSRPTLWQLLSPAHQQMVADMKPIDEILSGQLSFGFKATLPIFSMFTEKAPVIKKRPCERDDEETENLKQQTKWHKGYHRMIDETPQIKR